MFPFLDCHELCHLCKSPVTYLQSFITGVTTSAGLLIYQQLIALCFPKKEITLLLQLEFSFCFQSHGSNKIQCLIHKSSLPNSHPAQYYHWCLAYGLRCCGAGDQGQGGSPSTNCPTCGASQQQLHSCGRWALNRIKQFQRKVEPGPTERSGAGTPRFSLNNQANWLLSSTSECRGNTNKIVGQTQVLIPALYLMTSSVTIRPTYTLLR